MIRLDFDIMKKLRDKAGHMAFDNALYNWSLGGSVPERFKIVPVDLWPGDAENGRWLCGDALGSGADYKQVGRSCWGQEGEGLHWQESLHGFEWLRDLRTLGSDQPRLLARAMISGWIEQYYGWDRFAWRADIAGHRLANWIGLYDFYGASADSEFQSRLRDAIMRQARHLARVLPAGLEGLPLLRAIRGLIYAGFSFEAREGWLVQGLDLLEQEIGKQILPDGGHISRSPAQLLEALRILIDIRSALLVSGYPAPEQITHTIDRMAQALRFFRYADRHLAIFNGAQEGHVAMMDAVLGASNAQGKLIRSLPHTGYERVTHGRSVLMVDTAPPPAYPYEAHTHAAPLAFEFSYGKERVFVSCGSHPYDPVWQDVLRGTAAHNALTIDHRNVCEIKSDGHLGRRLAKVDVSRDDTRDATLIEGAHDGYFTLNGVTHRRRLYLGNLGHDLRGEENITCTTGMNRPLDVALRFHLHPRALVSLIRDGQEALIRLPGGAGWRFTHSAGELALENSIYLGQGSRPRKTKQLVIYGVMERDHAKIKWALQRENR